MSLYYDTKLFFVSILRHKIIHVLSHEINIVLWYKIVSVIRNWFLSLYYDTIIFHPALTQNWFWSLYRNTKLSLYYDTKLVFIPIIWRKIYFRPCTMTWNWILSLYYYAKFVFVPLLWHKIGFCPCIVTQNCSYSMKQNWFSSLYYYTKLIFVFVLWHKCSNILTQNFPVLWHEIGFHFCSVTQFDFCPFTMKQSWFCPYNMTRNWFSLLYYNIKLVFVPVLSH